MKSILFLVSTFFVSMVFAVPTLSEVNVLNVSYWDETNKTIYGGVAGTCTSTSTTSTCDSCTQTAGTLTPCNQNRIHSTLLLTITFKSSVDLTGRSNSVAIAHDIIGTTKQIFTSSYAIGQAASSTYTVSVPWSSICNAWSATANLDSNCESTSGAGLDTYATGKNLYIYIDEDKNGVTDSDYSNAYPISIHAIDTTSAPTYTQQAYCPGAANTSTNFGLCFYSLAAGDEKLVVQESPETQATTNAPSSSPSYWGAAFFAVPVTGSEASTISSFMPGQATPTIMQFESTSQLKLKQSYIANLANDVPYCVIAGQINMAKNIFGYVMTSPDTAQMCGTPSEVVGLLDDKHCFISTAAFGSDMASEVVLFREFRNKVLAPSKMGARFIHYYYTYSPPIADFISRSEILKSITRGVLYPFLGFSWLALRIGFLPATFFALLTLIAAFHLRRRLGQIFSRPNRVDSSKGFR